MWYHVMWLKHTDILGDCATTESFGMSVHFTRPHNVTYQNSLLWGPQMSDILGCSNVMLVGVDWSSFWQRDVKGLSSFSVFCLTFTIFLYHPYCYCLQSCCTVGFKILYSQRKDLKSCIPRWLFFIKAWYRFFFVQCCPSIPSQVFEASEENSIWWSIASKDWNLRCCKICSWCCNFKKTIR